MKIYTRKGDKGETSLVGGLRISKDSVKVEAYGTVDELNSVIGIARAFHNEAGCEDETCKRIEDEFKRIQNNLLNIGSNLATPKDKKTDTMPKIKNEEIKRLEDFIDHMFKDLKPLTTFILPSGGKISSFLHHARTICRRAERRIIALAKLEDVDEMVLKYINRLSDTLYAMARWEAQNHNEPEYYWDKNL